MRKIPLPMQLLTMVAFVGFFGNNLPLVLVRSIFTVSILFKTILMALLPFLIFSYVVTGVVALRKNGPLVLAVLLGLVSVSNFLVGMISYATAVSILPWLMSQKVAMVTAQSIWTIEPYFQFSIPTLFKSEQALLAALIVGIVLALRPVFPAERFFHRLKRIIELFVRYGLMPFLPLYVLGFLLKIQREGFLDQVFGNYSKTFLLIFVLQWILLVVWYLLSQNGSVQQAKEKIMIALPSYLTAMSTMSSTATIPVTLVCAEKNRVHRGLAHVSIPILANIHLLGDAVSVPLLSLVTSMLFLGQIPSFAGYCWFLGYFVVSMLAVAGVPGGGIMVMIPILQSLLGFTPDMISLITALYLMQDSIGTAANVMGDGALVMMIERVVRKIRPLHETAL